MAGEKRKRSESDDGLRSDGEVEGSKTAMDKNIVVGGLAASEDAPGSTSNQRPSMTAPDEELRTSTTPKVKGTKTPRQKRGPSPKTSGSSAKSKKTHPSPNAGDSEKVIEHDEEAEKPAEEAEEIRTFRPDDDDDEAETDVRKSIEVEAEKPVSTVTQLRDILSTLSESQKQRYEVYRRSNLDRTAVKKIMSDVVQWAVADADQTPLTPAMPIIMATCAKLFVGDLVEKAREHMEKQGESGPIQPRHIREAHRVLSKQGKAEVGAKKLKRLLK